MCITHSMAAQGISPSPPSLPVKVRPQQQQPHCCACSPGAALSLHPAPSRLFLLQESSPWNLGGSSLTAALVYPGGCELSSTFPLLSPSQAGSSLLLFGDPVCQESFLLLLALPWPASSPLGVGYMEHLSQNPVGEAKCQGALTPP